MPLHAKSPPLFQALVATQTLKTWARAVQCLAHGGHTCDDLRRLSDNGLHQALQLTQLRLQVLGRSEGASQLPLPMAASHLVLQLLKRDQNQNYSFAGSQRLEGLAHNST